MIRLYVEEYCNACPCFEAHTETLESFEGADTYIECANKEKCDVIRQYLLSQEQ